MSKIEDVSEAIADETEIAAIEEAGIIAQSQSAEDDGNPADRRLPLIARIYGIVMLIEGVVTLPIIVISCLYAVHAALSGKLAFGALNLTTILSVIHAVVLLVSTACLAIFGMLLILNKRRHIAQWTYLMIPLTLVVAGFGRESDQSDRAAACIGCVAYYGRSVAARGASFAVRASSFGCAQRV